MKSEEIKEFSLVIIQSLNDDDVSTGDILFEETIRYKKFEEPNLSSEIHHVTDKAGLFLLLKDIKRRVEEDKLYPILHFETHGGEDGILLSSGETLNWAELMSHFRELNIAMANDLVIILAACASVSIIGVIDPDDRAPFRAIIAATRDISQIDLRNGFEVFYNKFFFTFDFEGCLKELNECIEEEKELFFILTAETLFDSIMDTNRNPKFFSDMVTMKAVEEKATNPSFENTCFEDVRSQVEKDIISLFENTAKEKGYFLMDDLK